MYTLLSIETAVQTISIVAKFLPVAASRRTCVATPTATPVSMDPVLVSRDEAVFERPEIESARRRRRRQTQGGGGKDLLGVDAHHKALAEETSGDRRCAAKSDPR